MSRSVEIDHDASSVISSILLSFTALVLDLVAMFACLTQPNEHFGQNDLDRFHDPCDETEHCQVTTESQRVRQNHLPL